MRFHFNTCIHTQKCANNCKKSVHRLGEHFQAVTILKAHAKVANNSDLYAVYSFGWRVRLRAVFFSPLFFFLFSCSSFSLVVPIWQFIRCTACNASSRHRRFSRSVLTNHKSLGVCSPGPAKPPDFTRLARLHARTNNTPVRSWHASQPAPTSVGRVRCTFRALCVCVCATARVLMEI